jgi:hypothetical protein
VSFFPDFGRGFFVSMKKENHCPQAGDWFSCGSVYWAARMASTPSLIPSTSGSFMISLTRAPNKALGMKTPYRSVCFSGLTCAETAGWLQSSLFCGCRQHFSSLMVAKTGQYRSVPSNAVLKSSARYASASASLIAGCSRSQSQPCPMVQ